MTVLLAKDTFGVYRPDAGKDEHGWALAEPQRFLGDETGNIQPDQRPQVQYQGQDRDHGTAEPNPLPTATGYLQPDTVTKAGDTLSTTTGESWVVRSTLPIRDPSGVGISCVVAQLAQGEFTL